MHKPEKIYPTIGCCGLDCGLCPRYYTDGTSRCPGCAGPDFVSRRPTCSFITCCVKKRGFEACGQCPEFPCTKFKTEEDYLQIKESSSYPPYKNVFPNLKYIKEYGIDKFIQQQKKKIELLETTIKYFNDGRSKSFFCRATALINLEILEILVKEEIYKIQSDSITDMKTRANNLRNVLKNPAIRQ